MDKGIINAIKAEWTMGKVPEFRTFQWPPKPWKVEISINVRIDWIFPEPDGEPPLADGMRRVLDECQFVNMYPTPDGPRATVLVKKWHDEPRTDA